MQKRYKKKRERNKVKLIEQKDETTSSIIIVAIVFVAFLSIYGLTVFLGNKGVFDKKYTPKEIGTATISYEYISIGTIFNRPEKEYYVLFKDEREKNSHLYINHLVSISNKVIYIVDMSKGNHKDYLKETSNRNANKVSNLAISDITLMRIKSGKNIEYLEGNDKITEFLEK